MLMLFAGLLMGSWLGFMAAIWLLWKKLERLGRILDEHGIYA